MRIDRTGEININNFGSEMTITRYKNKEDIDIYFSDYNWTFEHATYGKFKKGESVSLSTIERICIALDCNIENIVQIKKEPAN